MSTVGKPLTAGVDLGGTKIQTVVLRDEEIVASARALTPQTGDAGDVIEAIAGTIRTSLGDAGANGDLRGIGIGTPGSIDADSGVVSLAANVPGFADHVELGPRVSQAMDGTKVTIDNDVRVGILGEYRRGAGRPFKNVLGVWVGTGVGGGLILDGELHDGRGAAGEIGHLIVKPGGRPCGCGRRGCLEAYAGRARMELRARQLHKQGHKTILFKVMEKKGRTRLTSGVWAKAIDDGDELAIELVDRAISYLGAGIGSAVNLLDPEAVVIGGGLGVRFGEEYVRRIEHAMMPHLFTSDRPPAIHPASLGDLGGALGASLLAARADGRRRAPAA